MPQRPEFFMGGGGAFSTPRDYMTFLQALLNSGALNGVRILRPETVTLMMQNQIGELNVHEMRSAQPGYSRSFDQFPGQPHKWGLSFDINTEPGPNGRSAGSVSWAGLLNCYFWIDPVKHITGALFTQILPFSYLSSRIVRDRVFRRIVLRAYDERCAISGLKLINGGGRAEVAAAHIQPVQANGPDIVSNGLALSGTAHWMFDRGLISLSDDLDVLISRHANDPDGVRAFVNRSGRAIAPQRAFERPHPHFLRWHREHCFKQ